MHLKNRTLKFRHIFFNSDKLIQIQTYLLFTDMITLLQTLNTHSKTYLPRSRFPQDTSYQSPSSLWREHPRHSNIRVDIQNIPTLHRQNIYLQRKKVDIYYRYDKGFGLCTRKNFTQIRAQKWVLVRNDQNI